MGAFDTSDMTTAKRHSALDEALEPLLHLMQRASTTDRDAILAYVLRRLSRACAGSRPGRR